MVTNALGIIPIRRFIKSVVLAWSLAGVAIGLSFLVTTKTQLFESNNALCQIRPVFYSIHIHSFSSIPFPSMTCLVFFKAIPWYNQFRLIILYVLQISSTVGYPCMLPELGLDVGES